MELEETAFTRAAEKKRERKRAKQIKYTRDKEEIRKEINDIIKMKGDNIGKLNEMLDALKNFKW